MKIVLKLHPCALYFLIRPKKQPIQQVSRRRPNCIEYPSIHIQHVQPGDLLEYVADEIPNAETIAAIKELDNGGGEHFTGSTEELFKKILSEPDEATGK